MILSSKQFQNGQVNATKEKYEDEEVMESYTKWALNQVTMLQQLQCRMLALKQTSSLPRLLKL